MRISSNDFGHNQKIPVRFTCDAEDINPSLVFSDIPKGTRSLVLVMDDPDATVGLWVHWVLWNIPANTKEVHEKSTPKGAVQGETSFGKPGYGGPCPPKGEHRYFFKLYALDIELNLAPDAGKEELEEAMIGHVLEHAELIGLYERVKA